MNYAHKKRMCLSKLAISHFFPENYPTSFFVSPCISGDLPKPHQHVPSTMSLSNSAHSTNPDETPFQHPFQPNHTFEHLQTLEHLTSIPDFIPDRIFPFLCGRDQLQLANTSPVLLRGLIHHLPPKIICSRCLKTLISITAIPNNVKFLLSDSHFSSTVAVTLCKNLSLHPLQSDDMKWTQNKFYVGEQKHKGAPVLHCNRCRNIVAILLTRSVKAPDLNTDEWHRSMGHVDLTEYHTAQIIVALNSSTKYIAV